MMTFSKDGALKRKLFLEIFHPFLFKCYVEEEKVLGLMGIATSEVRPLKFSYDVWHGKIKGNSNFAYKEARISICFFSGGMVTCHHSVFNFNLMIFLRKYEPVEKLLQYIGVRVKTYSRLEVKRKDDL